VTKCWKVSTFRPYGALQKIKCPTLVLQGDWANGGAMRDEDADFVRANLPSAVIVNNPNRVTSCRMSIPASFLQHMNAFLARCDRRRLYSV
jgi:hypothetical protein